MPKRPRPEDWRWSLEEREERLLPLKGFRIWPEEARIECVLNLVEGHHLVRPFALKSGWAGFNRAFEELLQWANPLFHPLSQSFGEIERRALRPRELREQASAQEERCGVRIDLACLARRIVSTLLLAAAKHRQESGGAFSSKDIQVAGVAAKIVVRSVCLECGPVHWSIRISNLEFVRRQAAALNRELRKVFENQAEWSAGVWGPGKASALQDSRWPANLLALLLIAGKRLSPQLVPHWRLFKFAFPEYRVAPGPRGPSYEDVQLSHFAEHRQASQRRTWERLRREGCLEFVIGDRHGASPYPSFVKRFGPALPQVEWSGGKLVRWPRFWDTGCSVFSEWECQFFDQSVEVPVI